VTDKPPCPPLVMVGLRDPEPAYLLAWEQVRGEWYAWVTWIRERGGHPYRHTVSVRAASVQAAEPAEAYRQVPRRVRGEDGVVRPWTPGP
jgi:hypothetical protein